MYDTDISDFRREELSDLEWENIQLRLELAEVRKDLKSYQVDLLKAHAALREVPKFIHFYVKGGQK